MSDDIVPSRLTAPAGPGNRGSILEIVRLFLRLGITAFGGPAAHVAVMETEVVTRRAWMTRGEFLDQLAVVQLLPGPNSTELAIHVGHALAGWRGGMAAGLSFVLPGVLLVWGLAASLSRAASRPAIETVMWWLVPAVVAVLLHALWNFGRQAAARRHARFVMPLTSVAAMVIHADMTILAIGAAAAIVLAGLSTRALAALFLIVAGTLGAGVVWAQTGHAPVTEAPGLLAVFLYFLRAGVSVFGSGYVLFSFLQHDLVAGRGWLSLEELTQGSAFAQVTPGPLFSTATAVGFSIAGHAGALAATVGIFAPAFLSLGISQPVRRLVRRSAIARAALDGVVVASVALLGRAVAGFGWPMLPSQWLICLLAATLLLSGRVSSTVLLVTAAAGGILADLLHLMPT